MASLTLRQCLEQVMTLGTEYVIIEQGIEWIAAELLAELTHSHPTGLELPMYLRLPDAQQDGAICQLTASGGYILRYRLRRHAARLNLENQ